MYKLPCPNDVLYLELATKQPPLGTGRKVVSLRPATAMRYIRTRDDVNILAALCLISSLTADTPCYS